MPGKPSAKEEEYFSRLEYERKKKIEEEKQKNLAAAEKKELGKLHYMRCPKCGMGLLEIDYEGIKADKCSNCEGIWLDAGELEAITKAGGGVVVKLFNAFRG